MWWCLVLEGSLVHSRLTSNSVACATIQVMRCGVNPRQGLVNSRNALYQPSHFLCFGEKSQGGEVGDTKQCFSPGDHAPAQCMLLTAPCTHCLFVFDSVRHQRWTLGPGFCTRRAEDVEYHCTLERLNGRHLWLLCA